MVINAGAVEKGLVDVDYSDDGEVSDVDLGEFTPHQDTDTAREGGSGGSGGGGLDVDPKMAVAGAVLVYLAVRGWSR